MSPRLPKPDLGIVLARAWQEFVRDMHADLALRGFDDLARNDGSFLGRVMTTGMSRLQYGIEDAREMSEVTATDEKLKPLVEATGGGTFWTRGGGLLSSVSSSGVELPRISMLANARVLAGSNWLGLKDREAFVTRGVKLIPMFTGFLALSALLALWALTWWREGR